MGLFKKPLRRSAARAAKRSLLDAARDVDPACWTDAGGVLKPPAASYVRFAVRRSNGEMIGLFQSFALIEWDQDLPRPALSQAHEAFGWFNRHVSVPRWLPKAGVCWFRADAIDCVDRARTLVEVYRLAGFQVWMLASRLPGRIVYRDEHQVVAVPHGDRRAVPTAC